MVYTSWLGAPSVDAVVPASGDVLVILTGELSVNSNSGTAFMTVELDNIQTTALDTNSLRVTGNSPVRASVEVLLTNSAPGTHTSPSRAK